METISICPTIPHGYRIATTYTDAVESDTGVTVRTYDIEPIPIEEVIAEAKARLIALVQRHLDTVAVSRGYVSIATAVTYADEPAVPLYQAEGAALRSWRSRVWAVCYQALADVEAGRRPIPTDEDLISELPVIEWPA